MRKNMELFYEKNKAKLLSARRPRALYVAGPDMDIDLVSTLVPGDQVLMEINGARYWSTLKNPLVAEHPWEVLENTFENDGGELTGHLSLRHPNVSHPIVLKYRDLAATERPENEKPNRKTTQPAVWVMTNPKVRSGQLYIILQMVAYRLPEDHVERVFPSKYDAETFVTMLQDDQVKRPMLEEWSKLFAGLDEKGWHHRSVKRFALRSAVAVAVVKALRNADWARLAQVTDGEFLNMRKEAHWCKYMMKQANLIQHAPEVEYVAPSEEKEAA
jgi:hypothetical protein